MIRFKQNKMSESFQGPEFTEDQQEQLAANNESNVEEPTVDELEARLSNLDIQITNVSTAIDDSREEERSISDFRDTVEDLMDTVHVTEDGEIIADVEAEMARRRPREMNEVPNFLLLESLQGIDSNQIEDVESYLSLVMLIEGSKEGALRSRRNTLDEQRRDLQDERREIRYDYLTLRVEDLRSQRSELAAEREELVQESHRLGNVEGNLNRIGELEARIEELDLDIARHNTELSNMRRSPGRSMRPLREQGERPSTPAEIEARIAEYTVDLEFKESDLEESGIDMEAFKVEAGLYRYLDQ